MDLNQFHFAYPIYLCALLVIPFVWLVYFYFYQINRPLHQLEKFIDSHLIPFLLINTNTKRKSWKYLVAWTVVWSFLTAALAGPRWNFEEMETFSKDQSLVVLLDLSESMNATDIKPSRLVRAKQKIEDLIHAAKGVKIGLIAFAADPHMITPLTNDKATIRQMLPSLESDIMYVQGSRLSPALEMAAVMLEAEPGSNKAILVISDGGFEDSKAIKTAKTLADKGIIIHTMGVGTIEGSLMNDKKGNLIKKNGAPILSKLEKELFAEISKAGNGSYFEAHHANHDEEIVLNELEKRAETQVELGKKTLFWEEQFYWLILPVLPIILWWFRKGYIVPVVCALMLQTFKIEASVLDYFKNTEQRGQEAFVNEDYDKATCTFQDFFRKGVSCYRAGDYAEAEKMFAQSTRPEVVCSAGYNKGNACVGQHKLKEAIAAYEEVLKKWPDHIKAKENLEIVKKMLDQQKQDKDQNKQDREQDKQDQNQDKQDKNKKKKDQDKQDQDQDKQDREQDQQDKEQDKQDKEQDKQDREQDQQDKEQDQDQDKQDQGQDRNDKQDSTDCEQQNGSQPKTQEECDADQLLNRIVNDPKSFMKNKCYIESKKNGTKEGIDPW